LSIGTLLHGIAAHESCRNTELAKLPAIPNF
jgi:hypothetical protein